MRKITGTAATALLLATALTGCSDGSGTSSAQTGAQGAVSAQGVTVVGVGTSSASPDLVHATVGVEVAAEELSEAFDAASSAAERVIAQLREQGVAQEDIQTRDLSVRRGHNDAAPPGARQPPSGYVVRNMLDITVRDVDRVGEVLAAAAEAGGDAIRIHGLRFALEDDAQQRQAREQAIEDARSQAEHYAELLDRELGELVSVSEARAGQVPPPAVGDAGELAPPPVEPGHSSVTVRVQATWELE